MSHGPLVTPVRSLVCLLILWLLFLSVPGVRGQNAQTAKPLPTPTATPEDPEIDPDDIISVNTSEVLLPVTVRDSTGRFVEGLTRNDFRVFEEGTLQPLSDISLRQVPVDVVLMVDASSSAVQNLEDFSRAAEGFASHLETD